MCMYIVKDVNNINLLEFLKVIFLENYHQPIFLKNKLGLTQEF